MKLDQLIYFLETAKHEHIGKASLVLAISPSAISHSISQLEEELGRDLFTKKGKKITLTDHGHLLMERAQELLNSVENIKEELKGDKLELRGNYRLAATHSLCANFLMPAWAKLQEENPKLTCEIYALRSSQVFAGVVTGTYDLGLCFSPQPHPELEIKTLKTGKIFITVRKNHPILKLPANKRLENISSYRAALPKAFQGVDICETHPMFVKYGIKPNADCLLDSYDVARQKLINSNSWGFFPDFIIKDYPDLVSLVEPKDWDAHYNISVVWANSRLLTEALKKTIDNIKL